MIYIGRLIDDEVLEDYIDSEDSGLMSAREFQYDYIECIHEQPLAFDVDMVLEQLENYGKFKGVLKLDDDKCENYILVSDAKQIVRGRGLGGVLGYLKENKELVKDCSTCKNNVEYPPPHTCDICTSLDQEEEYEMWEEKDNNE